MRNAGVIGFGMVAAGFIWSFVDGYLFRWFSSLTGVLYSLPWFCAAGSLVVFYGSVVRGARSSMVQWAIIAAMLVGLSKLFSWGRHLYFYTSEINMSFGEALSVSIRDSQYSRIRYLLEAIVLIALLLTISRVGRIMIDRRLLRIVVVYVGVVVINCIFLIPYNLQNIQHYSGSFGNPAALYYLSLALEILAALGLALFWGSLVLAQKRHWRVEAG